MRDIGLMENQIYVSLFGTFEITYNNKILNYDEIRSDRIVKLLVYLIIHKSQTITVQELSDVIWGYEEIDNPAGALKNLVYRCRTLLKKEMGIDNCIITGRGSYSWNQDIGLRTDLDEFDEVVEALKEDNQNVDELLKLSNIYKGPISSKLANEHWMLSMSTYYHSSYLAYVKILAQKLEELCEYKTMEEVVKVAIAIDPLDEVLNYLQIKSLYRQGNQSLALDHYKSYVKVLYKELGIQPSEDMQKLYLDLQKVSKIQETDLKAIQEDLKESTTVKTAFYCEYGTFKDVYRLQSRMAGRLGISIYIALITISIVNEKNLTQNEFQKRISKHMEHMEEILLNSLRVGDTVSRYSLSQYVMLLPTCTYEDGVMVMQRVQDKYYRGNKNHNSQIQYSLREMELSDRNYLGGGING